VLHLVEAVRGRVVVGGEVDVDELEQEFGRVGVQRRLEAEGAVVRRYVGDGAEVVRLACGEEQQLVEEVEGRGAGLVDAGYDDELRK